MVESSTTRSHTKIHSAVFFFGFVDSRDFCSFRSAGEKRSEKKELSGNSHHSSRHFSERSARHPPAHTMQIFVKTRTSSPSLSIENPVSPPLRLHRGAAAARASVDRSERRIVAFSIARQLRPLAFALRDDRAPRAAPPLTVRSLPPRHTHPRSTSVHRTQSPARPSPWRLSPRTRSTTSRRRSKTRKASPRTSSA
jgi:hypothetical protein